MKKERKEENKEKKKIDARSIWTKILAGFLLIMMLLGTCYTFIYLVINA